jgi:uracil-DNA glycosylase family 4
MAGRRRVLSEANGRPGAVVCFVGEAPGRRGAERTAIPFSGDQSGRNFAALLDCAGLSRDQIFVTNAVLCNPQDQSGRNRPPSRDELANCRGLLARQLHLIGASVVVPLGAVALAALDALEPHGLRLREVVARAVPWHGRLLFPLYHPGPRAQLHRPFALQRADLTALGDLVRSVQAGTFP